MTDGEPVSTHIVLIGLMGSGKTSVGRGIAKLLDLPLIDVDDVIRERTAMTVRELWEQGGEAAYRPLERDAVLDVLVEDHPVVLATPAGAVMDDLVRQGIEVADAFTVWLRAEPQTLAARVSPSDHRPLLAQDPLTTLQEMAEQRSATYEELADLVLDVDQRSPGQLAAAVVTAFEQR